MYAKEKKSGRVASRRFLGEKEGEKCNQSEGRIKLQASREKNLSDRWGEADREGSNLSTLGGGKKRKEPETLVGISEGGHNLGRGNGSHAYIIQQKRKNRMPPRRKRKDIGTEKHLSQQREIGETTNGWEECYFSDEVYGSAKSEGGGLSATSRVQGKRGDDR